MDPLEFASVTDYIEIGEINGPHGIFLVRNIKTGRNYVRKDLDIYNLSIYQLLFKDHVSGTPKIEALFENEHTLTVIEEYIEGHTLSEFAEQFAGHFQSIINIVTHLCDIIYTLHKHNPPIIHRDIKPSNIMVSESGQVYLLDFNAAKFLNSKAEKDTVLLGTPGYAAPEQYGFSSSNEQTDIYALGVLIKTMSKEFPEDQTSVYQHIWDKCTRMDPAARYDNVLELKNDLLDPVASDTVNKRTYIKFLPPGYRTVTPWKMLIATLFYTALIFLDCSLEVKNSNSQAEILVNKIIFAMICLAIVWIPFNYLDIQKLNPMCKSRYFPVRIIGIILLIIAFILALLLLFVIITQAIT